MRLENYHSSMLLLLLRHGDAGEPGPQWPDDQKRPLTAKGHRQARRQGLFAALIGLTPTRACASPLTRARETANGFLTAWRKPVKLETLDALSPGGDLDRLLEAVRDCREDGVLLLCGHNPSLSTFSGMVGCELEFSKGMLAVYEFGGKRGRGTLELLARPGLLEAIEK